ncbi:MULTISPECIES: DUF1850 domain-containing protein [unclassified Halomonas]|jgi:hypothetical protein|uniref:DUF1850 domain-containing protein n=1 Tax=unclassified Halomonas TaxID=2609666 RepID=UPI003FDB0F77|tara:strand:+ start:169 stop:630 length:462 start_codon:yes stop_codon:yes gene_type:complete
MALAALMLLSAASSTKAMSLVIEDFRPSIQLDCIDIVDQSFSLTFIHSVSLTPVRDQYRIIGGDDNDHRIMQTEERFIAHGQGLPSMENEPDAIEFEHQDGQFILHLKRPIDKLIVRTDSRFKNRLQTGKTTIDLNQWPNSGLWIYPVSQCQK